MGKTIFLYFFVLFTFIFYLHSSHTRLKIHTFGKFTFLPSLESYAVIDYERWCTCFRVIRQISDIYTRIFTLF
jgi:hypothetical protein